MSKIDAKLIFQIIVGIIFISILSSCFHSETVPTVRAHFIMLKTAEVTKILNRFSILAEQNNLRKENVTMDPIEDAFKNYRSGDEKTIVIIYSKPVKPSKDYMVLSIENTKLYCGLDVALSVIDKEHPLYF